MQATDRFSIPIDALVKIGKLLDNGRINLGQFIRQRIPFCFDQIGVGVPSLEVFARVDFSDAGIELGDSFLQTSDGTLGLANCGVACIRIAVGNIEGGGGLSFDYSLRLDYRCFGFFNKLD